MGMSVCKTFTFDAAHYLPNYEGKCRNLHGHTFKLEVEVSAEGLIEGGSQTGMVIDFGVIERLVKDFVMVELDHKLLNDIIPNPTAENICQWIWKELAYLLGGEKPKKRPEWTTWNTRKLERIRLYETPGSFAELKQ